MSVQKKEYEKPEIKRVTFDDAEVVSMADPCKDITLPEGLSGCQGQLGPLSGPGS